MRITWAFVTGLALASPAHAGLLSRKTPEVAPVPSAACEFVLDPAGPIEPEVVDHLEDLLRWIATIHPVVEQALGGKLEWQTSLFVLSMTNGFVIAPPAPADPRQERTRCEYEWFRSVVDRGQQVSTIFHDGRVLSDSSGDLAARARIVDRLFANLSHFLAFFARNGQKHHVTQKGPGDITFPVYPRFGDDSEAIRVGAAAALAALEDPRALRHARDFLLSEAPSIVRIAHARAAKITTVLASTEIRLTREIAAQARDLDEAIARFGVRLRGAPRPPEPDGGTGRAPFDARRFVDHPDRAVNAEQPAPPSTLQSELHAATAGLNEILLRAKTWEATEIDWAAWAEDTSPTREWIGRLLAALEFRRAEAFKLLDGLASTRDEVTQLAAWLARHDEVIARTSGAAHLPQASERVGQTLRKVTTAIDARAHLENEMISSIHVLELFVADHLRQRLRGAAATSLPTEFTTHLLTMAKLVRESP